jgi:prepilin-type processing-associated H-X9-DG protein
MAPNYNGNLALSTSWTGDTTNAPNLPAGRVGVPGMTTGTQRNCTQINALFCDLHVETMTFAPAATAGTFQDAASPLGLKHWDPRQ